MFGNKDKHRRQGAMMVFEEISKLKEGDLVTIIGNKGNQKTFKRVK